MPRPPLTGRAFTSGERSRRQRQREAAELAALRAECEKLRATVADLCAVLRERCPTCPVLENEATDA